MSTKISLNRYNWIKPLGAIVILGIVGITAMGCQISPLSLTKSPKVTTDQANVAVSSQVLPQPQENGDYRRSPHMTWKVVDKNPSGLDCHMVNTSYEELIDPRNSVTLDIKNWPIVGTLKQGQDFQINPGPAGFGVVYDTQRNPWMFVETSDSQGGTHDCFVRANDQFVQPINVQAVND